MKATLRTSQEAGGIIMSYIIIGDSCTDLTEELKQKEHIYLVPLSITIDSDTIIDDASFDQADFLRKIAASPNCPKSACPSPDAYAQYFDQADEIYIVTLSGNLSGSYNSALIAADIYREDHPDKKIHVIDSCSASVGQTLIVLKIEELKAAGKSFEEICEEITLFRDKKRTLFVLESLDTLRKNGRLSNIKAILASALNIKPVMCGTVDGMIEKVDQARGINRAIQMMARYVAQDAAGAANRILAIAHCNNRERAEYTRDTITRLISFKDVIIVDTAGISSLYANDGGIIVSW